MTLEEIRTALDERTVRMAGKAIQQGCDAARRTKKESLKQEQLEDKGESFNYKLKHAHYEGVRIAAEILFVLFCECSAQIQSAIRKVAKETDMYTQNDEYFDRFVEACIAENRRISLRTDK